MATNADASGDVAEEVSTLGVTAEDEQLSDDEEDDFPSAYEIVEAQAVVNPLGDVLASQSALRLDGHLVC